MTPAGNDHLVTTFTNDGKSSKPKPGTSADTPPPAGTQAGERMVTTWRDLAECRHHPTSWWFPPKPVTAQSIIETKNAKTICGRCPVDLECIADAAARFEQYGIWGGLVPRRLGALRRAADAGPPAGSDWRIGQPAILTGSSAVAVGTAA